MKELTVAYTVHKGFECEPQATQCIRVFLKGAIGGKRSSNIGALITHSESCCIKNVKVDFSSCNDMISYHIRKLAY